MPTRRTILIGSAATVALLAAPPAQANPLVTAAWWMTREVFKELAVGVVAWGVTELAGYAYDWLTDETEASDVSETPAFASGAYASTFTDYALQPEPGSARVQQPVQVGPIHVTIAGPLCIATHPRNRSDLNGHELRTLTGRRNRGGSFLVPHGARHIADDALARRVMVRRDFDPARYVARYQRTFIDPRRRTTVQGVFVQRRHSRHAQRPGEQRYARLILV
jgi:hypothetical protein